MSREPTIGRIVHYRVKGDDLRRASLWVPGAKLYFVDADTEALGRGISEPNSNIERMEWAGNVARPGDVLPLVVVRPWHQPGRYVKGESVLNGRVLLDGPGDLWALSVPESGGAYGDGPGTWSWPEVKP